MKELGIDIETYSSNDLVRGGCEKGDFSDANNKAYIVELSNGTKFLCFMRELDPTVDILSEHGEVANNYTDKTCYDRVKRNIHNLNNSYNERNY